MSEPLAEGMTGTAPPRLERNEEGRFVCPECGETFAYAVQAGNHRKRAHGIAGAPRERKAKRERAPEYEEPSRARASTSTATAGKSRGAELNRLRRDLKKSVSALALLPFMAKGTAANLANPEVTKLLDAKAEGFADAWVAVAEQNEYVRQNLAMLLAGGVWLNAAAQTATLGYVVALFSGFAPLHPGALMLLPELQQFTFVPPPPPSSTNGQSQTPGGETAGAESPGTA